jgi:hypothetical protein
VTDDTAYRGREFVGFTFAVRVLSEIGLPLSDEHRRKMLRVVQSVANGKLTLENGSQEFLAKHPNMAPDLAELFATDTNANIAREREAAQRIIATFLEVAEYNDILDGNE